MVTGKGEVDRQIVGDGCHLLEAAPGLDAFDGGQGHAHDRMYSDLREVLMKDQYANIFLDCMACLPLSPSMTYLPFST